MTDPTTTAPQGAATTPAEAPVQTQADPAITAAPAAVTPAPVAPPAAAPAAAPTPEDQAMAKQQEAQQALLKVRKDKEDACAREIQQVCAKHGCELIVGH